jgi:hypothetical protein
MAIKADVPVRIISLLVYLGMPSENRRSQDAYFIRPPAFRSSPDSRHPQAQLWLDLRRLRPIFQPLMMMLFEQVRKYSSASC